MLKKFVVKTMLAVVASVPVFTAHAAVDGLYVCTNEASYTVFITVHSAADGTVGFAVASPLPIKDLEDFGFGIGKMSGNIFSYTDDSGGEGTFVFSNGSFIHQGLHSLGQCNKIFGPA